MRIAMWSGPRNLSTAMMYAFATRGDCGVWDEPFYAAYLKVTGIDHPMRAQILAAHETDPDVIARRCAGDAPGGEPLFYQKQMTMHLVPGFDRSFMRSCENVFLIRHPARVVASYARKREGPTLADIGYVQQAELFDEVAGWLGRPPLVIDSADIRRNPGAALANLCAGLGIPYSEAMLNWPAGGHPSDGIWASHWYGAVHRSTGFDEPEGPLPDLSPPDAELVRQALPHYERLAAHRIRT
ncbi:HAD family hydrolase [Cereibacter azotoformans]|nr:sulfotransferase family protein [Cereibacter azotoformans]AXQ94956.1 HAD family hydrolase [Cereibacter sphaeroides]MBO4170164.1 HAD family hydrolase [Cereibacter azotoformans]UIJ30541.1 HAD family hydrolase [Cereibacter azotoformans]